MEILTHTLPRCSSNPCSPISSARARLTQSRHSGELSKSLQPQCMHTKLALNGLSRLLHSISHVTCNWVPGSCVACEIFSALCCPCQWTFCSPTCLLITSHSHCSSSARLGHLRPSMKAWNRRLCSCIVTSRRSTVLCSPNAVFSDGHTWSQIPKSPCKRMVAMTGNQQASIAAICLLTEKASATSYHACIRAARDLTD